MEAAEAVLCKEGGEAAVREQRGVVVGAALELRGELRDRHWRMGEGMSADLHGAIGGDSDGEEIASIERACASLI